MSFCYPLGQGVILYDFFWRMPEFQFSVGRWPCWFQTSTWSEDNSSKCIVFFTGGNGWNIVPWQKQVKKNCCCCCCYNDSKHSWIGVLLAHGIFLTSSSCFMDCFKLLHYDVATIDLRQGFFAQRELCISPFMKEFISLGYLYPESKIESEICLSTWVLEVLWVSDNRRPRKMTDNQMCFSLPKPQRKRPCKNRPPGIYL